MRIASRTATLLAAATLTLLALNSLGCEHKVREARFDRSAPLLPAVADASMSRVDR